MHKLALVQGEISMKEICNDIKNADKLSEAIDHDYNKYEFRSLVKIKNISFKYPDREITLDNIVFVIFYYNFFFKNCCLSFFVNKNSFGCNIQIFRQR